MAKGNTNTDKLNDVADTSIPSCASFKWKAVFKDGKMPVMTVLSMMLMSKISHKITNQKLALYRGSLNSDVSFDFSCKLLELDDDREFPSFYAQ